MSVDFTDRDRDTRVVRKTHCCSQSCCLALFVTYNAEHTIDDNIFIVLFYNNHPESNPESGGNQSTR